MQGMCGNFRGWSPYHRCGGAGGEDVGDAGAIAGAGKTISASGRQMAATANASRLSGLLVEAAETNWFEAGVPVGGVDQRAEIFLPNVKQRFADDLPDGLRSDFLVLERAMELARQVQFDLARCASRG